MTPEPAPAVHDRFTSRLEAFSDLVFGFSLSLLATRLDVPRSAAEIYDSTRWFAVIGTFGFVCRFWLEHYRVFRHRFVATMFDAVVNFIFLFGIAVLPYTVQTVLRFEMVFPAFALYVGDFSLILVGLSILRVRGLRQRRGSGDLSGRMRDWRRSLLQVGIAAIMSLLILAVGLRGGDLQQGLRAYDGYIVLGFIAIALGTRFFCRKLPPFLADSPAV